MKRILFLSGNLFPCHAGDSIFSAGLLENLARTYYVDSLFFFQNNKYLRDENYLRIQRQCTNMYAIQHVYSRYDRYKLYIKYGHSMILINSEFIKKLEALVINNVYDYIIIDHLRMYGAYKQIKELVNKKTKIILIEHNNEFINMKETIDFQQGFISKVKVFLLNIGLRKYEINAIRKVDQLWTLSKEDLDCLVKNTGFRGTTKIISPFFPYQSIKNNNEILHNSYNLLFLGSMSWYPNVLGIKYFIENVFEKILKVDSRYKLYIVGNNPHESLLKYVSDKIIITGGVESVDQYIKMSDFLIMPNKLGSGVKIKVLEAILKGIPVIGFKEGLIGYPENIFNNEFCVESDDDFVSSIIRLNGNSELKRKFISNAQKILNKNIPIEIND